MADHKNRESAGFGFGKVLGNAGKAFTDASGKAVEAASKAVSDVSGAMGKAANDISVAATDAVGKTRDKINAVMDVNGDGNVDIQDIIIMGLRIPGIRIDRAVFLKTEFLKKFPVDVIDDAIAHNPAHAGIQVADVDKIADDVIAFERNCVSGISAALGMPGGFAMAATIPADIAQYYGYMLRAAQKLMYLYGFPQIDTEQTGTTFDSETINILIICLGAMYGAAGAGNAIKTMAKALAIGVEKRLLRTALTKGTLYPIVKSVARWFNVRMTKQLFAGFFKKAIPVVGGVIGGTITFVTFKPCCDMLKTSLQDTVLSNPNHHTAEPDETILLDDEQ